VKKSGDATKKKTATSRGRKKKGASHGELKGKKKAERGTTTSTEENEKGLKPSL